MEKIEINPGDMAVVDHPSTIGKLIKKIERKLFHTPGSYDHAFFFTKSDGTILEAEFKYQYANVSEYDGCNMFLVRDLRMTPERYAAGFNAVKDDIGNLYPIWRFPLFLLHIDSFFKFGEGTCMEQTAKFMKGAGFTNIVYGITPDEGALLWAENVVEDKMEVIFEGIFKKEYIIG